MSTLALAYTLTLETSVSTITEDAIDSHLSTSLAGSPPLDIFVRTSGVKRLSGFLTWQVSRLGIVRSSSSPTAGTVL